MYDKEYSDSFYIKDTCICKINVSLKHVIKFESIKIKFY